MDRREGARILRETVALLEALEEKRKQDPWRYTLADDGILLGRLAYMRTALEGVAERLAEDEARESEAHKP